MFILLTNLVIITHLFNLRKGNGTKWENKWFIDIKDPSIWGRLTAEQKKEHLEKETQATTIGGELK